MQTQNPAAPQVDGVEWGVRRTSMYLGLTLSAFRGMKRFPARLGSSVG